MKIDWVYSVHWTLVLHIMHILKGVTANPAPQGNSRTATVPKERSEFLEVGPQGGFRFEYNTGDLGRHYHIASATPDNTVSGQYIHRDPTTGGNQWTKYTAGKRGFRVVGSHIARKMDLSQIKIPYNPPVPESSPLYNPTYSTYHDPNEDPTYDFNFNIPSHSRREGSDSNGYVTGKYTFRDDVGMPHEVEYEAGSRIGFHVKNAHPDSSPVPPSVFYAGPPANKKGERRGHTSVVRGKDGTYHFTAVGPDQRRTETKDPSGIVRGSYTYVDDKGVQRTTEYIAGPNIGYKVINTHTNNRFPVVPYLPPYQTVPSNKPASSSLSPDGDFGGAGLDSKPPIFGSSETEDKNHPPYGATTGGGYGEPPKDNGESRPGISGSPVGSKPVGGGNPIVPIDFPGEKPNGGNTAAIKPDEVGGTEEPTGEPWQGNVNKHPVTTESPSTTTKPSHGGGGGGVSNKFPDLFPDSPGEFPNYSEDDYDENHDHVLPGTVDGHESVNSGTIIQTTRPPPSSSDIPYGNCCKFVSNRGTRKYNSPDERRHSRKPSSSKSYSQVRDFSQSHSSEEFLGFPPGVAVRARVQSLDLKTYGTRIPSPSVAIDHPEETKSRREVGSFEDESSISEERKFST